MYRFKKEAIQAYNIYLMMRSKNDFCCFIKRRFSTRIFSNTPNVCFDEAEALFKRDGDVVKCLEVNDAGTEIFTEPCT